MILAHIHHPGTYLPFMKSDVWQEALDWIKSYAHTSSEGIFELRGRDMYVYVHGYDTLPAEECRFESHKRYIDLQYCISGGERIAWELTPNLTPDGDYNSEKDVQFYQSHHTFNILSLTPGHFAVFYPEDAHRPKEQDGINPSVWKLVVKVHLDMLQ